MKTQNEEINEEACRIISALGGTGATAEFFEIKSASVSDWKKTGIPPARLKTLKHSHPQLFKSAA